VPEDLVASAVKLRVGFVLAPRFTLTAFAGFIDVIRLAGDEADRSRQIDCQWEVIAPDEALIASSCGVLIKPWGDYGDPARFDYIVVVGGLLHGGQQVPPGMAAFLSLAARRGVPLIGLCTGSFILARAGLLDGYQVCVSWFHRAEFDAEFPDLRVQSNRQFVVDRDRMTCAGGTSVLHLAAQLIERHCGRAQALKSLRVMIDEEPLPSGAWQPEQIVTRQAGDAIVRRAMLAIEQDLAGATTYRAIATGLGIGLRQLSRRFVADVGLTPHDYRTQLRLARADWMIRQTDRSMTEIAFECGYTDSAHLSRTFRTRFGMAPSQARRISRGPCPPDPET
jgi:transcriptional regulator GlxA family with amidase domain